MKADVNINECLEHKCNTNESSINEDKLRSLVFPRHKCPMIANMHSHSSSTCLTPP